MSEPNSYSEPGPALLSATTSGELAVAAIILSFTLFTVAFVLCLRAKGYTGTMGSSLSRSRSSLVYSASTNSPSHEAPRRALDPFILEKLPVTVFRSKGVEPELECAVCLSELRDGEESRFLPTCGHGFHVGCIDMWFQSNSTCPLCRDIVKLGSNNVSSDGISSVAIDVVVVSGTAGADEGSSRMMMRCDTRQKGMLAIEIPTMSTLPAEGIIKSPEALERWRSLRRILSRGRLDINEGAATAASCNIPRASDIEQGDTTGSALDLHAAHVH